MRLIITVDVYVGTEVVQDADHVHCVGQEHAQKELPRVVLLREEYLDKLCAKHLLISQAGHEDVEIAKVVFKPADFNDPD